MSKWDILQVKSLKVEHQVPDAVVRRALAEGRLSRDDCLRRPGDERWWRIYELAEFRSEPTEAAGMEEPPRLQEGSLRNLLADVEPSQPARSLPRKPPAAAPSGAPKPPAPAPDPPTPTAPDNPSTPEPMLFPRKRIADTEDLDMAPAATVAFLLLLFFVIVSGVAVQRAIEFPNPSGDDRAQAKPQIQTLDDLKKDNIVVKIRADNSILIDEEPARESELVAKISTLKRDRAATDLIIRAEDEAYHQTVVAVVDAANLVGNLTVKMAAPVKAPKKATKRRPIKN